ncbi:MAG: hypothetical protein MR008_04490 [Aerococcus sp.]|nr:hypothetical protein [Aerococcus sp.]
MNSALLKREDFDELVRAINFQAMELNEFKEEMKLLSEVDFEHLSPEQIEELKHFINDSANRTEQMTETGYMMSQILQNAKALLEVENYF